MSPLRLVLLGLAAGSVAAPQLAGAQVTVSCTLTVRVCVQTATGLVCDNTVVPVACPGSGARHLAYKDALVVRGRKVKEGSECVLERKGAGHDVTIHGKAHNGACNLDHPLL
jgi:hypothetical protein